MEHSIKMFQEHLARSARCPLCLASYDPLVAKMVQGRGGTDFMHVECASCHGALVARVATSATGITSIGLMSDVSAPDLARMVDQEAVTSTDVLECFHATQQPDFMIDLQ